MKISIITVCHKSRLKIYGYINSFLKYHSKNEDKNKYQFIFVENSGDDEFRVALNPLFDAGFEVVLLNTANHGFGVGCNVGAKYASGEIIIFANPDIRFLSSLDALYSRKYDHYLWGTVRQYMSNGTLHSIDVFPEKKGISFEIFRFYRVVNKLPGLFLRNCYVVGSFLIVSKNVFEQIGGFNESFFLYYEEAELARRLHSNCGNPFIEDDVKVLHEGFGSHSSSDEIFKNEANGFLKYCKVTNQSSLIGKRITMLRIMSLFSKSSKKRLNALMKIIQHTYQT